MEGFEEFWQENFKEVTDPLTIAIARASWNGCWTKVVEDYTNRKEDENYSWEWRK